MSDLQCPARFLACALSETTAEELRGERVAAVYDGTSKGLAQALAGDLGVPVQATAHPVSFGDVATREAGVLDLLSELADLHRGETVVVAVDDGPDEQSDVSPTERGATERGATERGADREAVEQRPAEGSSPPARRTGRRVEVRIDADGVQVLPG